MAITTSTAYSTVILRCALERRADGGNFIPNE